MTSPPRRAPSPQRRSPQRRSPPRRSRSPPPAHTSAGLPYLATPADNLVAAARVFAIADPANLAANPLAIEHGVALVRRALEQPVNGADLDGRLYSRQATTQRNSNGGREIAANRDNCLPPRNNGAEHSTNNNGRGDRSRGRAAEGAAAAAAAPQPRNQRALAPNDACHTITRNRSERSAANSDDARHTIVQCRENREADTEASSSRLGPKCFGRRITGERYPEGFKGPRGVPIYEANMDPKTWIDN